MSAEVLPFPLQPSLKRVVRTSDTLVGVAEITPIKPDTDDFLSADLACLEAQLPLLAGNWITCASKGEAMLLRRSGWEAPWETVVIRREGERLRLMIDEPQVGLQTVGLLCDMTIVMEILTGYMGGRRRKREPQNGRSKSL